MLYQKATLSSFVYHYYLKNKPFFTSLHSPSDLIVKFIPGEKEWASLSEFALKDSIPLNTLTIKGKAEILRRVKTLMSRQIWRTEGYFQANNLNDNTVQKAIISFK